VSEPRRFTALVMAGSRAAGDPLARASGVGDKAFVPVAGVPMLVRVLDALRAARQVGQIVVLGLDPPYVQHELGLSVSDAQALTFERGGRSPADSARVAIEGLGLEAPLLITTADHPLLTAAMVDEFCDGSLAGGGDVTFGVTDGAGVATMFPGIRRTVHRFGRDNVCGCNLFALLSPAGCTAPGIWMRVESYRKQPWRMVAILGVPVLVRFLFGRLALSDVSDVIQSRFGLRAQPIHLSDPAAGFDVDTIEQRGVAERYLQGPL
jgi:GTP:adenosylcobinamide-phosphate guanylyltransferase